MIEDTKLAELMKLPPAERLELARILMESAVKLDPQKNSNGGGRAALLSIAGRYAGGQGTSSENDESILEAEIDSISGLSVR